MMRQQLATLCVLTLALAGLIACGGGGAGAPPGPQVTSIEPASGGLPGGSLVTVRGSGLLDVIAVRFPVDEGTDLQILDDETLTCRTPPGTSLGNAPVVVETAEGSAEVPGGFTYHPAPVLGAISPAFGPLAGGQRLTCRGSGFLVNDAGQNRVTVAGRDATGVVVVNDTTFECTTPPGPVVGTYDVGMWNQNGGSIRTSAYRYVSPPTLIQIAANSGPAGGNIPVTLTGTGFDVGTARVMFGAAEAASVVVTTATTLTCLTPAGTAGLTSVTVETAGGTVVQPDFYTYTTWTPSDTLYSNQWHLYNDGTLGSNYATGEDSNVVPVWTLGYTGSGIRINVLDDGLEIAHEDLTGNVISGASWDYLNGDNDPTMGEHGTSVAGVAAAVGANTLGGTGAAPNAALAGYNVLMAQTDATFIDALTRNAAQTGVANMSYGVWPISGNPSTFWGFNGWSGATASAVASGLATGRGGKGIVYVKSAGNHRPYVAHYEDFNNFRGVMCIGAVNSLGTYSYYSQPGANVLVCTHSSGVAGITTTDRTGSAGYNTSGNYTGSFGGTSSAAPLASGLIALVLEANQNLRWWEVPVILARTARRVDANFSDWTQNGANHWVSYQYGFGVIDTEAAVNMARTWTPMTGLVSTSGSQSVGQTVTAGGSAVTSTITIPSTASVKATHSVTATLVINHVRASDLEIKLTSPDGTESVYCPSQTYSNTQLNSASGHALLSFRHLDEDPAGNWTMSVRDGVGTYNCTWTSWSITIDGVGSSSGGSKKPAAAAEKPARRPPMPAATRADEVVWWNGRQWARAWRDASLTADFASAAVLADAPRAGAETYPVFRDGPDGRGRIRALTGRLIVRLDESLDAQAIEDWEARHRLTRRRELAAGPHWLLYDIPGHGTETIELANALLAEPDVILAQPDWWSHRYDH